MLSTELTTGFGDTGLEQEWRTLWRWLAEMRPRDIEIFSLVIYLSNTITSNVCSELSVGEHGVVSETSFPELVEHLEIFVCSCISLPWTKSARVVWHGILSRYIWIAQPETTAWMNRFLMTSDMQEQTNISRCSTSYSMPHDPR
jgi:hypothetical protein